MSWNTFRCALPSHSDRLNCHQVIWFALLEATIAIRIRVSIPCYRTFPVQAPCFKTLNLVNTLFYLVHNNCTNDVPPSTRVPNCQNVETVHSMIGNAKTYVLAQNISPHRNVSQHYLAYQAGEFFFSQTVPPISGTDSDE